MNSSSSWNIWKNALLSTILISTLPNILLFLFPADFLTSRRGAKFNLQRVLLCFAAGGLLGDVFLHLLPHLISPHDHNESFKEQESHHVHNHNHGGDHHHHHHHEQFQETVSHHSHDHSIIEGVPLVGLGVIMGIVIFLFAEIIVSKYLDHSHCHSQVPNGQKERKSLWSRMAPSGWLNLFADSLHNLTDGIALGASFASGNGTSIALATVLSVLFHEIPHEVGDMTILMTNGLSKIEAIKTQFVTALAAVLGTIIGLCFERYKSAEKVLLTLTAGGFIYISCVTIIPQLLKETNDKKNCEKDKDERVRNISLIPIAVELFSFLAGVGVMVLVLFFEDH